MIKIYECTACHWQGDENQINKECTYPGSLEEPPEWEWRCPDCNRPDTMEEQDFPLCYTCEDVMVHHEGEQCTECIMANVERLADEAKGH